MAVQSTTATLLVPIRDGDAGDRDIVVTWSLASPAQYEITYTVVQNTTTAIPIPSTATICIVIPPSDNTQQVRVDDASGKKCGMNKPFVLLVDGDSTLTLHLAAGTNQTFRIICI